MILNEKIKFYKLLKIKKGFELTWILIYFNLIIFKINIMKLLNNDIKEVESGILWFPHTGWNYEIAETKMSECIKYLKKKYNLNNIWLDNWREKWFDYLNNLSEVDTLNLLDFSKKLCIKNFWNKYWYIAFSNFAWNLMEDEEEYSNTINKSKSINKILLKEFIYTYQFYQKNHKYEIGKFIYRCMKNLCISLENPYNLDIYDFWEKYNPKSENFNVK